MREQFPSPESSDAKTLNRESIIRRIREWREMQDQDLELPSEVLNLYPRFIQREVVDNFNRLRESFTVLKEASLAGDRRYGYEEQQFAIAEAARIYDEKYRDPLTNLTNKEFAKKTLLEAIEGACGTESSSELPPVARIAIDLNGLKAVNDLSGDGHRGGDQYLIAIADWLHGSFVLHDLENKGCTVRRSREGGDEFSITITGKADADPVPTNFWEDVVTRLRQELASVDVRKLLTAEQAQGLLTDAPGTFTFRATAGIGMATLPEILNQENLGTKNHITATDTPEKMLHKLMGALFDASDSAMMADKRATKEQLQHGDAEDKTLMLLLTRTEEQRGLEEENQKLRDRLRETIS